MADAAQVLPVRIHQTSNRIVLTAPMPGLEPQNIRIRVDGARVAIHGDERGPHQRETGLVIAEWTIGPYQREVELVEPVDGALTNATYANGVLVLTMPKVSAGQSGVPAEFRLTAVEATRGERVGHVGRDPTPHTTEEHWQDKHRWSSAFSGASPWRRIVVPLDGSPEGESVLPLAERLASTSHAELVLLQVLLPHTTMAVDLPVPIIEETFREARLEAERYLQDTADMIVAKGGRAQVTVRSGDPATEIVNAAHDLGADLVAMATHGRSGIRRALFGSVAEGVLRRAPVPLLLVHGRTPDAARHAA